MKTNLLKAVSKAAFLLSIGLTIVAVSCKNNTKESSSENAESIEQTDSVPQLESVLTLQELSDKIRENPLDPDLFAQRSGYRAVNKEFNQALGDIEIALKLDSLNPQYYVMQAEYFIYNGQPSSAKKGLNDCLSLFPKNTEVMLKIAEIHFYLKEYQQAQRMLQAVTTLDQDIAQIYFLNGLIFLEKTDTASALKNLQFSTEKDPDFYSAFMMLGQIHNGMNSKMAIDYYRSAIDVIPESYEARYNLGMFYQGQEMIAEAELEYNYIIYEIDSTSANPFYNLGYINLIYKGEYEKAIDFFTRAIQKNPEYVEAWYNRGFSYEVMGNLKLARENYTRSLQIQTNYPLSIKGLNRLDNGKPFKF